MINMEIPFFSIVLCTFNRQELLRRAINSVINQFESDWELIIIDDGSSDNTEKVVSEFITGFPNIYYYYHNNIGAALSKNEGIKVARGKYITFLDSDDEYDSLHLKNNKEYLEEHPGIEFLHGTPTIIGNQFVPDKDNSDLLIHINDCFVGGTFFLKRESVGKIGLFCSVKYGEDAILAESSLMNGCAICKINMPSYIYYRNNKDSLCNIILEKKIN